MKKIYALSFAFATLCASASYAQIAEPTARWAHLFTSGATTGVQSSALIADADNSVYTLETPATIAGATDVQWNSSKVFEATSPAKNTNNLLLAKIDQQGNLLWSINSSLSGDYASNKGNLAITSDGDIIFTAKVRHTDGILDTPMALSDSQGNIVEFDSPVAQRYYSVIVGRASSDGILKWVRQISPATELSQFDDAKFVSDAIDVNALALDADDNIFVGGLQKTDITLAKADNTTADIAVRNIDSTTKASAGSFYLVKLDQNGYYLGSLAPAAETLSASSVQDLEVNGDRLYAYFHIKASSADANNSLTLGDFDLTATDIDCPVFAALSTDLEPSWVKVITAEKVAGKSGLQNGHITVAGSNLWYCAQYQDKLSDGDNSIEATQGTQREGCIIKFDAANGAWLAAANNRPDFDATGIVGYFKAFQLSDNDQTIYTYGYNMGTSKVFLRGYSATDLQPLTDRSYDLISSAGTVTALQFAYNPDASTAYVTARSNKAFELLGATEPTPAPSSWAVVLASFELPSDMTSAITSITADSDDAPVQYFNLQGQQVENPANGIYIRRQGATIEKVIIK